MHIRAWLKHKVLWFSLAVFISGFWGGYFVRDRFIHPNRGRTQALLSQIQPLRLNSDHLTFTNPLLGYEIPEGVALREYKPLEEKISQFIESKIGSKAATDIAVYFRDQDKGRWVGVNEEHVFSPASLLKVALMIAYYKFSESQPEMLKEKIVWSGDPDLNSTETIKPPVALEPHKIYSVSELIEHMIRYSDNNATALLLAHMDHNSLEEVFSDLRIKLPKDGVQSDFISTKSYALFFRVLYNASYLNITMSEKALELLSQTSFQDGLTAGVPENIKVSHKFGEYSSVTPDGLMVSAELHDCGDVYYPDHAYLLCVMTKGQDLNKLKSVIKEMSALVYNEMQDEYH